MREVSRLTWSPASIPQNAIPFTEGGHPYVLEFDEYNAATLGSGSADEVGAARIIDIADETHPRVVSDLRLQVNQPADHKAASGDPGATSPVQGYAAHYCNIPSRVDPKIVACSFIVSGLRLFDISDLVHPKEIGYFVAPTKAKAENEGQASDFAMSQPAFVPERHEVWFTDGTSGFYVLRVADDVWPGSAPSPAPACAGARLRTAHVALPRRSHVRSVAGGPRGQARARVALRPHAERARRPARLDQAHGAPARPGAAQQRADAAREPRLPPVRVAQTRCGSMRIFAWRSGSPRSVNASATPSRPTVPVISGDGSTLPWASMCSVSRNSSGV